MSQAKNGDKVKVHYTGKYEGGEVFDTSREREPFEFTLGQGQVIPGFEKEIEGMDVGQTKTITIPPDEAYGQRREDLQVNVNRTEFPEDIKPEVGQQLQMKKPDGNIINVTVADVQEETVTLDANHPLAGKTLTFEIELLEVA
jgi:FKBP-type peptidyl-prolyl cis-trans isomerase 2